MKRGLVLVVFAATIAWCWPRLQSLPQTSFVIAEKSSTAVTGTARVAESTALHSQLLPNAGASAHAVTLAQRSDGALIAAWFTGSREGASDVAIVSSVYEKGQWSTPQTIVDRQQVQHDMHRLIRKLGNPLLWRDPQGILHLWFVSVSYGGWAGSAINHMQSDDGGKQWSAATRIVASPFWNLSTLVRNPPLALADGGFALPAYHEFLGKRPEWLRFDKQGKLIDNPRIRDGAGTLQPAAVALDAQRALMLMRDAGPLHRIQATHSDNAGSQWQSTQPTSIANPNAAIALLQLADGSLLLACNPVDANRNQLALLRSRDEGRSWSAPMVIEQGSENDEFSYPALLQDSVGNVHLAYTWQRRAIKHESLPYASIEAMP